MVHFISQQAQVSHATVRLPQYFAGTIMLTLVIGNKNLSSWSLRPWLVLKHFGLAFEEIKLPLDTPAFQRDILKYSPTSRVPVLIDGSGRQHHLGFAGHRRVSQREGARSRHGPPMPASAHMHEP